MNKIVLIDGNNLIFRSFFATAATGNIMKNSHGLPTNAIYGFINMMNKIIDEEKPSYVMVAFDKGKTFRHQEYAEYKGGRDEIANELLVQLPYARKACIALGCPYFEIENYEADDIIGTFAKKVNESDDFEALIISSDKDLLQLITDKVKVKLLKMHDYIMMDKKEFNNTYGIDPIKMIDLKALMGDSSDNIPGVKGIGEKTGLNLLQKYGSLDGVYNNIDDITGKMKEKLLNDKVQAYMSYHLATIYQEVPINTDFNNIKYQGINEDYPNLLQELEFFSLLKKVSVPKSVVKELKYEVINDLHDVIKEDEYSFYLEILGYNYHRGKPLGVTITTSSHNYFIPIDLLKGTDFFNDGLKKYTYDLKKSLVVFHNLEINIDRNCDDIMIMAYLLNKNIKNDIAYLANSYDYDIAFYDKTFGTNITLHEVEEDLYVKEMAKKSSFIYEKRKEFIDELTKDEQLSLYHDIELPLCFVLAKMELNGFRVDLDYFIGMKDEIKKKIDELANDIYFIADCEFNISSPKQLGDILFNKLNIPYPKRIKDNNYSTSKDILDKVSSYDIVQKVLDYRTYTKLYSTYLVSLMDEVMSDSKIHTIYNQTLTRTGRLSSEQPNLQNIPIRLEEGRLIRKGFIPRENSIIISSDYSQVELRVFAHMAKAKNMIEAFNGDIDIHTKTASDIFHVPVDMVDKNMRRNAKAVNFGIIYGISSFGLSDDLGINLADAKKFMDSYLKSYPEISEFMKKIVDDAKKNLYVKTLFGRKRVIEELSNKNYIIRSSGERMAMNTPIQGTAADIIKMAMIKMQDEIDKRNLNSQMLVQVHDELVFDVPENEVTIMKDLIKDVMENIYKLDVPLKVDIEYGKTWYDAK